MVKTVTHSSKIELIFQTNKKDTFQLFLTGDTAGLVKEPSVYAGMHTINLKMSDMQGHFGIYNISATVCDCSVTPNCQSHRNISTKAAPGAIGIIFAALLLLLCKKVNLCL